MFNPRVGNLQIPFTWRKTMYIGLIRASVLAANWDKWRAGPVCRWPVSWPDINLILTFPLSPPDQTFFHHIACTTLSRNVFQPCVHAWLVNKLWQIFPITLFPSTYKGVKVRPYIYSLKGHRRTIKGKYQQGYYSFEVKVTQLKGQYRKYRNMSFFCKNKLKSWKICKQRRWSNPRSAASKSYFTVYTFSLM